MTHSPDYSLTPVTDHTTSQHNAGVVSAIILRLQPRTGEDWSAQVHHAQRAKVALDVHREFPYAGQS